MNDIEEASSDELRMLMISSSSCFDQHCVWDLDSASSLLFNPDMGFGNPKLSELRAFKLQLMTSGALDITPCSIYVPKITPSHKLQGIEWLAPPLTWTPWLICTA